MEDENEVVNLCCDLVAAAKHIRFVPQLLSFPPGQWLDLRDLLLEGGIVVDNISAAKYVVVAWLDDPASRSDFVAIIFHNYESLYTMCAHFNLAALPPT